MSGALWHFFWNSDDWGAGGSPPPPPPPAPDPGAGGGHDEYQPASDEYWMQRELSMKRNLGRDKPAPKPKLAVIPPAPPPRPLTAFESLQPRALPRYVAEARTLSTTVPRIRNPRQRSDQTSRLNELEAVIRHLKTRRQAQLSARIKLVRRRLQLLSKAQQLISSIVTLSNRR